MLPSRTEYVQDTVYEDRHQQQHAGHQGAGDLLYAQDGAEEAEQRRCVKRSDVTRVGGVNFVTSIHIMTLQVIINEAYHLIKLVY